MRGKPFPFLPLSPSLSLHQKSILWSYADYLAGSCVCQNLFIKALSNNPEIPGQSGEQFRTPGLILF